MASNWFSDLEQDDFFSRPKDDFFSRPSRLRLIRSDPWGSLERLHEDLGTSSIFSDFTTKAANLRDRVAQGRFQRVSPVKKEALRRTSQSSEQGLEGVASPTPSSLDSAAFQYPEGLQGRVSFPNSSCSNVSDCTDKSPESVCTEKSYTHAAVSEVLPGGGEQRKNDTTESWVERNSGGGVVGVGSAAESMTTETRPGMLQEHCKQKTTYVGTTASGDSVQSMQTCEETSSQTSSSKTVTRQSVSQATATSKKEAESYTGKPFRVPPNRSVFYDELDSSLLSERVGGLGARRRVRPLDHVASLLDEVVHHDRLFQSELDDFLRGRPKRNVSSRPFSSNDKAEGLNSFSANQASLKKENETLQEEITRLQQVLQEVTAVNKRWQRYNNDRRMYVQKLLGTIQDMQEQMNQHGEAALQRASADIGLADRELERLRRQHEEQTQLMRLQIKSYKDDWDAERREKQKAEKANEDLIEQVNKLQEEVVRLKTELDDERLRKSTCSCQVSVSSDASHIVSQDFTPRTAYQASFQVPYSPTKEMVTYTEPETMSLNIMDEESAVVSPQVEEVDDSKVNGDDGKNPPNPQPRSFFLGYPDSGLASVYSFSQSETSFRNGRSSPRPKSSNQPCPQSYQTNAVDQGETVICPNCHRVFPPSLHLCFLDHFEFCQSTDVTGRGNFPHS